MSATANGPTLFGANGQSLTKKQKDAYGRVLTHNATVEDVYQIVVDECAKVHEYYLTQIPQYVARMIQDALVSYGLVQLTEPAAEGEQPGVVATPVAPVVSENAGGDTTAPDTNAPEGCACEPSDPMECDRAACGREPTA